MAKIEEIKLNTTNGHHSLMFLLWDQFYHEFVGANKLDFFFLSGSSSRTYIHYSTPFNTSTRINFLVIYVEKEMPYK